MMLSQAQIAVQAHLFRLSQQDVMPVGHLDYIRRVIKGQYRFEPKVIYDIGSCVLHWTKPVHKIWPNAKIVLFEAIEETEFLYQGFDYHIGVLSNVDGKIVDFYKNVGSPGGSSYFKEIGCGEVSKQLFNESTKFKRVTETVDSVVKRKNLPLPDLVKMDIQGAEMDVLDGMKDTLKTCQHLILELQHVQYNEGAPLAEQAVKHVESLGFKLVTPLFHCNGAFDGDYHFVR